MRKELEGKRDDRISVNNFWELKKLYWFIHLILILKEGQNAPIVLPSLAMFVERKVRYSALFTNLVGLYCC